MRKTKTIVKVYKTPKYVVRKTLTTTVKPRKK